MTYLILTGGLGNQLFFASYLLSNSKRSIINLTFFREYNPQWTKRSLSQLTTKLILGHSSHVILLRISLLAHYFLSFGFKRVTIEEAMEVLPDAGVLARIKHELFLLVEKELAFSSLEDNGFIGIHFRFGDFINNPNPKHQLLDPEYYRTVLDSLGEFNDRALYVFTDDPVRAKEYMCDVSNYVIVSDLKLSLEAELLLMSNSSILIASNSTLSVWAGMLSKNQVIAPRLLLENYPQFHKLNWTWI